MSYWDTESIEERIRERYARRFIYLASVLVFLVLFIVTMTDENVRWVGIVLLVWPIAHTAYLLFEEFSARALKKEMSERDIKVKNEVRHALHLTDDGEINIASYDDSESTTKSVYKQDS